VAERPLRADARRNRERVLEAARELFAVQGGAVPLDEIAARAGVGPGTVYRHFPTKEALFEAVTEARLRDLVEYARAEADAADPGAAFAGFLDRMAGEAVARRNLQEAFGPTGSDGLAPVRAEMYAALDVLLSRAQEAGAVRAGIRVPDLIALLKAVAQVAADTADPGTLERVAAVVRDGLRPPDGRQFNLSTEPGAPAGP
jgi:AcrR family transcriptional regulator